jgi:hypothetical protein
MLHHHCLFGAKSSLSNLYAGAGVSFVAGCSGNPQQGTGYTFACKQYTQVGDACAVTCNSGYIGTAFANCQEGGIWPAPTVDCRSSTGCSGNPPANPENAAFSCGPSTAVLATCTAQCNNGYSGTATATCNKDGTWGPVTGSCSSPGAVLYLRWLVVLLPSCSVCYCIARWCMHNTSVVRRDKDNACLRGGLLNRIYASGVWEDNQMFQPA